MMTQFYRRHKVDPNTPEWQKHLCEGGIAEDLAAIEIKV